MLCHHAAGWCLVNAARDISRRGLAFVPHTANGFIVRRVAIATRDLGACAVDWRTLEQYSVPNPFLTHAWMDAWWRIFGADLEPYLLVVQDADAATVGIAPLVRTFASTAWGGSVATLRFMGWNISDRLGFVCRASLEREVVTAIVTYLRQNHDDWHVLECMNLPEGSPTIDALRAGFARDHLLIDEPGLACPYLTIEEDWTSFLHTRSSNFRAELRRSRRRAEREAGAIVRICSDPDDVRAALMFLFRHSIERFQDGPGSTFADHRVQAFHLALAHAFLDVGRLSISSMEIDGRIAAVIYNFVHGRTVWFYNAAFDAHFERYKPGAVLLGHAIEDAFAQGAKEFDFLLGDYPYKQRWANHARRHRIVTVVRPRPAAIVAAAVPRWWLRLKQRVASVLRDRCTTADALQRHQNGVADLKRRDQRDRCPPGQSLQRYPCERIDLITSARTGGTNR